MRDHAAVVETVNAVNVLPEAAPAGAVPGAASAGGAAGRWDGGRKWRRGGGRGRGEECSGAHAGRSEESAARTTLRGR